VGFSPKNPIFLIIDQDVYHVFAYRFVVVVLAFSSFANAASCKSVPGTPFWPSTAEWHAFNNSIGGQLIKRE
jgi:hypothetical protein